MFDRGVQSGMANTMNAKETIGEKIKESMSRWQDKLRCKRVDGGPTKLVMGITFANQTTILSCAKLIKICSSVVCVMKYSSISKTLFALSMAPNRNAQSISVCGIS